MSGEECGKCLVLQGDDYYPRAVDEHLEELHALLASEREKVRSLQEDLDRALFFLGGCHDPMEVHYGYRHDDCSDYDVHQFLRSLEARRALSDSRSAGKDEGKRT